MLSGCSHKLEDSLELLHVVSNETHKIDKWNLNLILYEQSLLMTSFERQVLGHHIEIKMAAFI